MIRFEEVSKHYSGGKDILQGVNLSLEQGEMVVVTGQSGAGKTTLLKLMAALERPSHGSVWLNEQNIGHLRRSAVPWLRRNIGFVFQDHRLLFDRDVLGNVLLPLEVAGFSRKDALARARAALDKVGLLDREKSRPIALSGGEQQRLCIARAVATRPPLILADEPTGNLDREYANSILDMLVNFNRQGTTVVIASHDADTVTTKHRTVRIHRGKLT